MCWDNLATAKLTRQPGCSAWKEVIFRRSKTYAALLCLMGGGRTELPWEMNGHRRREGVGLSLVSAVWTLGLGWSTEPARSVRAHHPAKVGGGGKPECSGKVKGKTRKHKLWGSQWCTLHIQWPLGGAAPSWTVGKETEITASEQVVGQLLKIPSSTEGVTLQNTASLCFSGKCSRIPAHPLDLIKVVGVVKLGAGGG